MVRRCDERTCSRSSPVVLDAGHLDMKRTRIFTGLVILTCLGAALLLFLAVDHVSRSGRVVGTVLFQGRPVCVGTIFFQSEDPRRSDGTTAQIDENGHFECEPGWHR